MNNDHANSNNNNDNKKALVIAVSDYENLQSLKFSKNDGEALYNILKKLGYNIPDKNKIIGNVSSTRLKMAIYDFFISEDNKPEDTLVFYYTGQGIPDISGEIYLAPSEINHDYPYLTGFSFNELTNSIHRCNSLRVVTILDTSYSGSLKMSSK